MLSASTSPSHSTATMNQDFQKHRTVVLLGDKKVGKTTLIKTLLETGKATPLAGPSDIREVTYKGVKIVMVDVGGETASIKSITPNTMRYAKAVILVYDITNHESLDNCKYWHQMAQQNSQKDGMLYALVGCKSDLRDDRQVAWDTADRVSNMLNAKLFEVSATKSSSCKDLMEWIYSIMKEVAVQDDLANDGSIKLGNPTQPKNNPAGDDNSSCSC